MQLVVRLGLHDAQRKACDSARVLVQRLRKRGKQISPTHLGVRRANDPHARVTRDENLPPFIVEFGGHRSREGLPVVGALHSRIARHGRRGRELMLL
jgi:hypothetical protein